MKSWSEGEPECEHCGAEVSEPVTAEEIERERQEDAELNWIEAQNDIF